MPTAKRSLAPRWAAHGLRVVAVGVVLLLVAAAAATARLFVFPVTGRPAPADAVIVLGGPDEPARLQRGAALVRVGFAPVLVVSFPPGNPTCQDGIPGLRVLCISPHPASTRGEGRQIELSARREHWHSLIIVTTRFQATRARLRVERCFGGRVTLATVSPALHTWAYQLAYEWGATAKAMLVQRGC